jgi:excinuclease UvrABC ATPase subunit
MTEVKYNDFPIEEVVKQAGERINEVRGEGHYAYVHQKWTCRHCGSRQTMGEPNAFHRSGRCEECDGISIIDKCNYVFIIPGGNQ